MSLLSEDQKQMSGISPQRKNRNKCKNKSRSEPSDQIPAQVLDEINRILEGRHSPIGCIDGDITDCKHDSKELNTSTLIKELKELEKHNNKDVVLEPKSVRCLLCRCPHNPERARLLAALELMSDSPQVSLWFCNSCKKIIEKERESNCSLTLKVTATNTTDCSTLSATTTISSSTSIATQTTNSSSTTTTTSTSISVTTSSCSCPICKRHDGQQPHEDLRTCWHELKSAILRIYRESGLVLNQTFMQQNRMELTLHQKCPLPSNDRLKEIVHKLCVHDRHKLYQCLEAQVRLFVVEMRLALLKHLEHGSQALFEAMIDQYSKLCRASKKSAQFLQELESKHLRKFNLTWEFLNRRLFQSTVYSDTFIKHGLPKLTALTKDRSLIDMYARFLKFEDEMTVISVVWREAQQFIDKYEKFAILNKKRALIKEWEQFSVEWVLDDHVSGAGGKGKSGSDSQMCIKKPSIECLNARFLEEQKLLKSGKNMQSVNIEVETHSSLQEQTLLAAYGEWDAIDIKTISNMPAPNKHLRSATASTQVDLLLTSKAKNESIKDVENNDEDECDEEEEEDEEEEDVEDEEDDEDDDDSCSDQSSTTSTSTSNNQRGEGGRVCDCCYCEVFGHGMPAVAPTSRNYNEMRERLRMRLSKRKAEKCEKNGTQNAIAIENNIKPKEQTEKEDERDLEELINFINGTDTNGKEKKQKREKQKKKKNLEKTKVLSEKDLVSKSLSTKVVEKENKPIINSNSTKTAENNQKNHKIDHKSNDRLPKDMSSPVVVVNNNNNSNHCIQNNITSKQLKEQHSTKINHLVANDSSPAPKPVTGNNADLQKFDALLAHQEMKSQMRRTQSTVGANNLNNNSINVVSNGNTTKNTKNNGNNKKKIKTSNDRRDENSLSQTPNHLHNQNNLKTVSERIVCNGLIPHHKQNGTVVSNGAKQLPNNSISPERVDSDLRHNIKQKQNKINKNRKKNTEEALSPDDVFMPKDIDLDNGELDEFEKELEAFKRFCFNSVPLKVKEKVNVNLKDIVIKKKNE